MIANDTVKNLPIGMMQTSGMNVATVASIGQVPTKNIFATNDPRYNIRKDPSQQNISSAEAVNEEYLKTHQLQDNKRSIVNEYGANVADLGAFMLGESTKVANLVGGITKAGGIATIASAGINTVGATMDANHDIIKLIDNYRAEIGAELHIDPKQVNEDILRNEVEKHPHKYETLKQELDRIDETKGIKITKGVAQTASGLAISGACAATVASGGTLLVPIVAMMAGGYIADKAIDCATGYNDDEKTQFQEIQAITEKIKAGEKIKPVDLYKTYLSGDKTFAAEFKHFSEQDFFDADDAKLNHIAKKYHGGLYAQCQNEANMINNGQITAQSLAYNSNNPSLYTEQYKQPCNNINTMGCQVSPMLNSPMLNQSIANYRS